MFTHTSRYFSLETAIYTAEDGKEHRYKRRRFLPDPHQMHALGEVTLSQGDRLDNISAQSLGDPEQFWRICDINRAMHPSDMTEEIGRVLCIPLAQFER